MADYVVPSIKWVREEGKRIVLDDELNDGRPVILDLIYTTTTALHQTFNYCTTDSMPPPEQQTPAGK